MAALEPAALEPAALEPAALEPAALEPAACVIAKVLFFAESLCTYSIQSLRQEKTLRDHEALRYAANTDKSGMSTWHDLARLVSST